MEKIARRGPRGKWRPQRLGPAPDPEVMRWWYIAAARREWRRQARARAA